MPTTSRLQRSASPPSWPLTVLVAILSGGLMAACYWPLNLHFLAWVALVPWLAILPRLTADRAWLFGTLTGLVFYIVGLRWLCAISGPLGVAIVLGLALWMGLSFRVARLLTDRFSTGVLFWVIPLAFTGQEIARSEGLARYRVAYLGWGYSQSHNLWVAQIASIGGVYLVTFLLVAFNAAVAYALLRRNWRRWTAVGLVAAIIVGAAAASQPAELPANRQVRVACVQAEEVAGSEYIRLTRRAINQPTPPSFVVLPEHAICDPADEQHPTIRGLSDLAREGNTYVCVGAHVRSRSGSGHSFDVTLQPSAMFSSGRAGSWPVVR